MIYSFFLDYDQPSFHDVNSDTLERLRSFGLLQSATVTGVELSSPINQPCRRQRWCNTKCKQGCRGGLTAKPKANPCRAPLPSVLLANVCSLESKLDYLQLDPTIKQEMIDSCVWILSEMWVNLDVPDDAVSLPGLTTFRLDRSQALSGKSHSGGLYINTNNKWCNNTAVALSQCTPDVELLTVKCRPFYLPREFTTVIIMAVYTPQCNHKRGPKCSVSDHQTCKLHTQREILTRLT